VKDARESASCWSFGWGREKKVYNTVIHFNKQKDGGLALFYSFEKVRVFRISLRKSGQIFAELQ
jgi:hypothetical protein